MVTTDLNRQLQRTRLKPENKKQKKTPPAFIHFSQMPLLIVGHNWLQPLAIIHFRSCTCDPGSSPGSTYPHIENALA